MECWDCTSKRLYVDIVRDSHGTALAVETLHPHRARHLPWTVRYREHRGERRCAPGSLTRAAHPGAWHGADGAFSGTVRHPFSRCERGRGRDLMTIAEAVHTAINEGYRVPHDDGSRPSSSGVHGCAAAWRRNHHEASLREALAAMFLDPAFLQALGCARDMEGIYPHGDWKIPHSSGFSGRPIGLSWCMQLTP